MPRHAEEMVLNVCTLALDLQRPHLLGNYLTPSVESGASTPLVRGKLRALAALQCLSHGDFAGAARQFASVESSIAGSFGSVLAGEDVALGAVLCGIAALQRGELRALLLENPRFKALLDAAPAVRQLLGHFLAGRYAEVKAAVAPGGEVHARVSVDPHLHQHAAALFITVQDKLVLQYFRPYNAIRMAKAVEDLYGSGGEGVEERAAQEEQLEQHVRRLVEEGQLQARIDAGCAEGCTLRRVSRDERALALQAVSQAAISSSAHITHAVLRLSLLKHSFAVSRQFFGGGGGGGEWFGGVVGLDEGGGHMQMDLE
jgi:hypothetical protein